MAVERDLHRQHNPEGGVRDFWQSNPDGGVKDVRSAFLFSAKEIFQ